jgi:hypothetical protein
MPKVQPYEPQVRPSPLQIPAQRLDPRGAFGEALVEGASRFASSMERIQDEDDKAVVKDRINQYRERSRARMFGDDDAFLNRQGKAAYDSRNDARDELSKYRDELSKGLSGNQQRMFGTLSQEYLDRDSDNIAKHAQKSRISWLNSEDEAAIESAQNDHALYWNAGDGENIRQIRGLVNNIAKRNGWGPEQKELKLEEALTAAHASAIDNILTDNPRGAEAYFLEHKGEISPKVWDDIKEKINKISTTKDAQDAADTIRISGGNLKERIAAVNEIEDPELRKLVRSQVEHDYELEKTMKAEATADAYDDFEKRVLNGESGLDISLDPRWDLLSADQQKSLISGEGAKFDPVAYKKASSLVMENKVQELREYVFNNRHLFEKSDYKKFISMEADSEEQKSYRTRQERLDYAIRNLNLNEKEEAEFQKEVDVEFELFFRKYNKNPSFQDEQLILDKLAMQTYQKKFFAIDSPVFFFQEPPEIKNQIEAFFDQNGRYPTTEEVDKIKESMKKRQPSEVPITQDQLSKVLSGGA